MGKRVQAPGERQMREIVGIARTANYSSFGEPPQRCVYVPLEQNQSPAMTLYVRSSGDPAQMVSAVRREIYAAGPQVLVSGVRTGQQVIDGSLFQARVGVALLSVFGLLALGLASIGLYGILAYAVSQRQREIGLRMALGASQPRVLRMVVKQGMSLVVIGMTIGFGAALLVGRFLGRMLFGVGAGDLVSLFGAASVLRCRRASGVLLSGALGHSRRSARGASAGVMPRTGAPTRRHARLVRLLRLFTLVLVLISVAMVMRRTRNPARPDFQFFAPSGSATLDTAFTRYAPLTMLHILPGLIFVVLGSLQFVKTLRTRRPRVHRRIGYIVLASGLVTGVTALAMTTQMAIGGATERAATALFGVLFLVALVRAFACIRRRHVALHREWMIRAFSLGLAVATVRPIVGAFFATRGLTRLSPPEFFGIAFWLGFTMHLIAAEAWINHTRALHCVFSWISPRQTLANGLLRWLTPKSTATTRSNRTTTNDVVGPT